MHSLPSLYVYTALLGGFKTLELHLAFGDLPYSPFNGDH